MRFWERQHFILRRMHSLSGIIPLGLFLTEHMISNITVLIGAEEFDRQVERLQSIPFLSLVEWVFIFLPFAFHAFYGIWIAFSTRNNPVSYRYSRNWAFWLQRVSAVFIFIFLLFHLYTLRLAKAIYGIDVGFATVSAYLSNPLYAALYAAGLLSALFHFSNGIFTFLITWGITVGPRSQRVTAWACTLFFILSGVLGIIMMRAFIIG